MFYPVEFLSLRRNGKFAKCWLAAHMTSREFHTKFRRHTIDSIDVIQTCNDVIEHIVAQNNCPRFSLSLTAHLMYGITKICSYQTKRLHAELCSFWTDYNVPRLIELDAGERKQSRLKKKKQLPDFDISLPPAEPPQSVHTMSVPEPYITMTELNDISTVLPILDEPYFGALTTEELDIMLQRDGLPFVLSPSLAVRSVPEPVPSPITPGIPGESRMPSPIILPAPDEVVGESIPTQVLRPREERPQTPKRPRLPHSPNDEIPPKIRRVLVADDVDGADEVAVVPILVEQSAAEPASSESSLHLQPLEIEACSRPIKTKKKRTVVDEYTRLERPSEDPFVHTRSKQDYPPIYVVTAPAELLTTPSKGQNLAKCLLLNYQMMMVQPIMDENKARREKEKKKTKLPRPMQPIVRHPDISGETTRGFTSEHEIVTIISRPNDSAADRTKTFEIIPITERTILSGQPEEPSIEREETHDTGLYPVPELPGVSGQLNEIQMIRPETVRLFTYPQKPWVKADLIATLRADWSGGKLLTFEDICPPVLSTKSDAAKLFQLLLVLHSDKDLQLKQAMPESPIYILQYSPEY